MIIRLKGSTGVPRVIWGSPIRCGTFLDLCFFIRATLVVEVALLSFEIIKHENQQKYRVLGSCWLRCLPRGCVFADSLASRISKNMCRKDCNYAGLVALFFPNQFKAAPGSQKGPHQPCRLTEPSWLTSPPEISFFYFSKPL